MQLKLNRSRTPGALTGLAVVLLALSATAPLAHAHDKGKGQGKATSKELFQSVASFDVMAGNGSSVAEIVDATRDGKQLIYTDSGNGEIGFVDIQRADRPRAQGVVAVGGEPTSLAILDSLVLVAVNTSESYIAPSGKLVVVDRRTRQIVAEHALPGHPDSIAIAPDQRRAALIIENERDEDLSDGLLPQYPSGALLIVDLKGAPSSWSIETTDLSQVAANATDGSDLEPEFVDINARNQAVVTFQENNHIAIVDLKRGKIVNEFSAGSVDLHNVDTNEEDLISLDSSITRRREPDAVAWIDNDYFATANEGDYEDAAGEEGGSRGFTVFNTSGEVVYESAEAFEHLLVSAGHYNESRSENKGVEPESVEYGKFGGESLLFVGSERSNAVAVYTVKKGKPELLQVLPTGIGPEGLKAIPKRDLFIASTETDVADAGIPTMINIYEIKKGQDKGNSKHKRNGKGDVSGPTYPMIVSANDEQGLPIPWVALSGMVGDPWDADTLYAVSDSFLAEGFIYTIDASHTPALIVDRLRVSGASNGLDLEGVAVGPDGNFWVGSEGAGPGGLENLVLKVDSTSGEVLSEIALPAGLVDQRRSNGIEGIAVTGSPGMEQVYVAIQRAWPNEGDTDKVNTKPGRYDVATGDWGFVHYPLEAEGNGDWIGLSELTLLPDGNFAVIERDKGWGPSTGPVAELKSVFAVDLASAEFRAYDDSAGLVSIDKSLLMDLLPEMKANSIWTAEKLEGFAIARDNKVYAVTDNDGVDDATGETLFLRLGELD